MPIETYIARWRSIDAAAAVTIGLLAAAIALVESAAARWMAIASVFTAFAICALWLRPNRWLYLFFISDFLLPPLPGLWRGAGIHISAVVAGLGIVAGVLQMPEWRFAKARLLVPLGGFALCLLATLPFAALYSGEEITAASFLRIVLFLIAAYVFIYALCGPRTPADEPSAFARFLFIVAVLAAAFACLDFYFHFPPPAGFSDQYVWLREGVFRRAQGLFYDASTLGNFCAFFLIYGLISLFERSRRDHPPRVVLITGMLVLAAALILSYSRASVLNVAIAALAYACLGGAGLRRALAAILVTGGIAALAVYLAFPSFAIDYWSRFETTIRFLGERPDNVLSGRLTSWGMLVDFIGAHPWQTIFGIGYKTLPYTTHFGDPIIADNTYLSLLVETGIAGLGSFLFLLWSILKACLRAARSGSSRASFLGKWAFCFWCGQTAQMFSGDLLTYWRVLPVYFWVLGAAIRETAVVE